MKGMASRKVLALFVVFLALLAFAVQADPFPVSAYTKVFEGIEYASGVITSPTLERAFAIRVSLRNPDVWLYATPTCNYPPYETNVQTTPAFLDLYNLQAAVNVNYGPPSPPNYPHTYCYGLLVSAGNVVSPGEWGLYSTQLRFTLDKIASMVVTGDTPGGIYNAIGGTEVLVSNGVNVGLNPDTQPRTVLGISQSGRYLIMVAVDGRRPGWSDGANSWDLGQWLLSFGAYNGFMVDGGGSTCIVRDGGSGNPVIMNNPCDGYPGSIPREVTANFGAGSAPSNHQGPNACSMNSNRVDICFRGNMNHIYVRTWTTSGGWQDPVDLGGTTMDQPTIVARQDGRMQVFALGTDGYMYKNPYADGVWSGWSILGGTSLKFNTGPAACAPDADHMSVVARGTDSAIKLITWASDTGWSAWSNLGGTASAQPAITSRYAASRDVFIRGTSNQLLHNYNNGGGWSGWISLGGNITTGPVASSEDVNHTEVFARGSTGTIMRIPYTEGIGWGAWQDRGGSDVSRPAATSTGYGVTHLFYRDAHDHLWKDVLTNGVGWSGWVDQGFYY